MQIKTYKKRTTPDSAKRLKSMHYTCRAQKYKSIYGSNGGSIRSNIQLFYEPPPLPPAHF